MHNLKILTIILFVFLIHIFSNNLKSQNIKKGFHFKVLAFYTGKNDMAHISYVKEANHYFDSLSKARNFDYEPENDWNKMTFDELSKYDVILFLDTRPENFDQRKAFQKYMEKGGGWIGFHFSSFALEKSTYENNWSWYHDIFLWDKPFLKNHTLKKKVFSFKVRFIH